MIRKVLGLAILVVLIFPFLVVLLLPYFSYHNESTTGKVHIKKSEGTYKLYRNGEPYAIRGAAGYTNFNALKNINGTTIRVWDTTGLASVLDSAAANDLTVIAGLPIANSDHMGLYNNPLKVSRQFERFKSVVNRFKNHPALLMWCVGNELDFPYKLSYNSFYNAFNQLVDMIHADDPDHPVTTTILNFNKKYIFNLQLRCKVDILSFNIFSRVSSFRKDLEGTDLFWRGPYMLTEWGADGPWDGTEQTAWGAYIENTSNKKAEFYLRRYQESVPVEDPRFLGAFVFYWGHKQEATHTWFSMFDEDGAKSEAVDVMKYIWTGKHFEHPFPQIKYMLLNKKGARDNVILNPDENSVAEVEMLNENKISFVKWEIMKEDWYKKNQIHNVKKMTPIENLMNDNKSLKVEFTAPKEEGPYRIFATVYNQYGHFSTCNTPFYVVRDNK